MDEQRSGLLYGVRNALRRQEHDKSLHQTLRRAGLPLRGVHALRHTFATRAMESGMDLRTLSEILGHSQVALTLQLYAHSTMETKRDVMEKMDVSL